MSSRSVKIEKLFSPLEAATFLRALADAIEEKSETHPPELELALDDFSKLKIGIKRQGELVQFKAKVKYDGPGSSMDPLAVDLPLDATMKYSTLKKRMERNFKSMGASLRAGMLPEATIVEAFLAESELMVSYPGYGDEYYTGYSAACGELYRHFLQGNVAAVAGQYEILAGMKKACHARYK